MLRVAILLVAATAAHAQDLAASGFAHFYNLEYEEALVDFRALEAKDSSVPDLHNHIAQTLLFREMYRSGALESQLVTLSDPFLRREKMNPSPEDEKEFNAAISRAMELAEARIETNPRDVRAHYALGVSYGLRANYKFLVRKAWIDGLRDATSARKAHNAATRIDPSFIDAQLVQGVYDYVVGSLPFSWKLLGFIAGFRGDRERGVATLKMVLEQGNLNRSDAAILLCALYRRERRASEAVPLLRQLITQFPRNYLFRLELVQMFGDLGDKGQALAVIDEVERLKREHAPGYAQIAEEKIRFTRGNLLFWYREYDQAVDNLRQVTSNADKVDLNTGSYAWLRLAQSYDTRGQRDLALAAYRETTRYAPNSDAAKEAQQYLSKRYVRRDYRE